MNTQSQWRIELARRIAPHYAAFPNVEAVVVLGGVARGWADAYSDIDLVVYWRSPPTQPERRTVIAALGAHPDPLGDRFATEPDPTLRYWWEEYYLGGDTHSGLKIDIGHHLSADMDAVIEAVTQRYDPHPLKHEMLYSIKGVVAFSGEALIARWKQAAGACPEPLARHFVENNLHLLPFWSAGAALHRGDWLMYTHILHEVCRRLLIAVVYLNREYFPGTKRQAHLLGELTVQPADFNLRIHQILRGEPAQAIAATDILYDEVVGLAHQHMPQADLTEARATFHFQRPRLEAPPAGLWG